MALVVEKYHCLLFVEHNGHYSIHKCLSLDPLLRQINPLGVILSLDTVKRQVFEIKIRNDVFGIGWVPALPVSSPFITFICGQQCKSRGSCLSSCYVLALVQMLSSRSVLRHLQATETEFHVKYYLTIF